MNLHVGLHDGRDSIDDTVTAGEHLFEFSPIQCRPSSDLPCEAAVLPPHMAKPHQIAISLDSVDDSLRCCRLRRRSGRDPNRCGEATPARAKQRLIATLDTEMVSAGTQSICGERPSIDPVLAVAVAVFSPPHLVKAVRSRGRPVDGNILGVLEELVKLGTAGGEYGGGVTSVWVANQGVQSSVWAYTAHTRYR